LSRLSLLLPLLPGLALAQGEDFRLPSELEDYPTGIGAGVVLGEPTGLSLVWREDAQNAIVGALAWSVPNDSLHLHADYQVNLISLDDPNAPEVAFPLYTGVGLRVRLGHDKASADPILGIRLPIGIAVLPPAVPVDAFMEIVPVMGLLPETSITLDGALGIRYYFR